MKRIFLFALIVIATICSTAQAGTVITQAQLPKEARNFISKYFSADKVRKIEKDQGHRGMEYEVDFISGAEVEFREDGNWKEVKAARGHAVPSAIVPTAISQYVKAKYAGQSIVKISLKRGAYEIKLSSGVELKLTKDGKPYTGGHDRQGSRKRK